MEALQRSSYNSITDDFCTAQKKVFNETNDNLAKGGIKGMGEAMDRGMVLIMVNNLTLIIFFSPHDGISCHVPLKQMLEQFSNKLSPLRMQGIVDHMYGEYQQITREDFESVCNNLFSKIVLYVMYIVGVFVFINT